ncbi:nucleotidyltransferase domain-containing protein [candidate division KSB1 bacterium]|nr:nucleotidyltransferase domain-containing protein [candidate division KSB1 bacterium]
MTERAFDIKPYVEGWRKRNAEAEAIMAERKKLAFQEARKIAQFLREAHGCARVVGIGSAFSQKDFTEHSDIDLVVYGLPKGKYFSICAEIRDFASFEVDVIPAEDARPLVLERVVQEGVEL